MEKIINDRTKAAKRLFNSVRNPRFPFAMIQSSPSPLCSSAHSPCQPGPREACPEDRHYLSGGGAKGLVQYRHPQSHRQRRAAIDFITGHQHGAGGALVRRGYSGNDIGKDRPRIDQGPAIRQPDIPFQNPSMPEEKEQNSVHDRTPLCQQ